MRLKPRKLPVPQQRPDGQWVMRWRFRLAGKEHRPQRLFPTQAAANDWILHELADASRLSPAERARTFNAYADAWLESKRRKGLKPSSLSFYAQALKHSWEYFGDRPVAEITPADADSFASWLWHRPKLGVARSVRAA